MLPCCEMSALVDLVEVEKLGIGTLGPAPGRLVDLSREHRDGYWDLDLCGLPGYRCRCGWRARLRSPIVRRRRSRQLRVLHAALTSTRLRERLVRQKGGVRFGMRCGASAVRVASYSPRAHETRRAPLNPSDEGIDDTFVSIRHAISRSQYQRLMDNWPLCEHSSMGPLHGVTEGREIVPGVRSPCVWVVGKAWARYREGGAAALHTESAQRLAQRGD
jgi:hypothetical protein